MMSTCPKKKIVALLAFAITLGGCTQVQRPALDPYLSTATPPAKQEFRWSNGKLPKSVDPALAAAAPETDLVRAVFEGLTSLDPKTLEPVPALAEKFSSSEDKKTWTFHLRKNAHWSNGRRVTANDVVASWKRVRDLADRAPHFELTKNIVGFRTQIVPVQDPARVESPITQQLGAQPHASPIDIEHSAENRNPKEIPFGVTAPDDATVVVALEYPDPDFPKLVADPMFRPVFQNGDGLAADELDKNTVTNGPFTITDVSKDGVLLGRSDTYWNKAAVKLDVIRLVPFDTAEAALEAYKRGDVDAVTNSAFEPLALKLLTPYDDFRRTPHSALNFYEFNLTRAPVADRRVRAALSYAIDRTKLAEVELEGAAVPADRILLAGETREPLVTDVDTAKGLLESAGFANGTGFPIIKLVISRNETQQKVAKAIARMWRQNLNLETEIIVKETTEMDQARASGDFDLIRRNVILPTADNFANLTAVFGSAMRPVVTTPTAGEDQKRGPMEPSADAPAEPKFEPMNEADLMYESRIIPLYFPVSYALVRPYVTGFETNPIDAVEFADIQIDSNWQPKRPGG